MKYDKISEVYLDLCESFDSKVEIAKVPEDSMLHVMGAMSAGMVGGTNFSMYETPEHGFLVQFDKDGATEVHHIDSNLQGGYKAKSGKSAIKFASIFAHHIKGLLDTGKAVRISAHHSNFDHFRKISDNLIKRNPDYSSSGVEESNHPITNERVHEWTIEKRK